MGTTLRSAKPTIRVRATKGPKQRGPRRPRKMDLETKTLPLQERSRGTFEAILRVAGEVLADKGADAFSMNEVCLRSGLSHPALYRYFPNKYAVLKALAQRLMDAGDDAVLSARSRCRLPQSERELIAELRTVITELVRVTASFPGSVQILRALRARPEMRQVQLASTARLAANRYERLRAMFPKADPERLRRSVWLGLETGNISMELVVEGAYAEGGATAQATIDDAAVLLGRYYWRLGVQEDLQEGTGAKSPKRR